MTTLTSTNPTLADLASLMAPDGTVAPVAELLHQISPVLEDATWVECNDGSGHKSAQRLGIPDATWRKINQGVAPTKGEYAQVRDACGMLEQYARVDKALADVSGDVGEFRFREAVGHIESQVQAFHTAFFYGDTDVNPERFMGIGPRFDDTTADNADNLIDAAGSGSDNTSIFVVRHSPLGCHLIYPKGSQAGLTRTDKGVMTVEDSSGNYYEAYVEHFKLDVGLAVPDWRNIVRIGSIDVSDLTKDAATGADLIDLLDQAVNLLPDTVDGMGRTVIYVNRTVRGFLARQMKNHTRVQLTMDETRMRPQLMFDGIPIKRCDAILNTEAAI